MCSTLQIDRFTCSSKIMVFETFGIESDFRNRRNGRGAEVKRKQHSLALASGPSGPGPGVRGTSRVRFFLSPPVVKVTAEKDRYRVNILMRFRFRRNDSGTSVLIVRLVVAFATLIKKDFRTYKSFVITWR